MKLPCGLLALDIDGTLRNTKGEITPRTRAALDACRKVGLFVTLATARSYKASRPIIEAYPPDGIVSAGGVLAQVGETLVYESYVPRATAQVFINDCLARGDIDVITMEDHANYYRNRHYTAEEMGDYAYGIYNDFSAPLAGDVHKITIETHNRETAYNLAAAYPQLLMVEFTGEHWYRYASRDAHKLNGVRAIAAHLGVPLEQVAAFGDDNSDLTMIQGCGIGVAMGNAIPAVKAVADYVTLPCDEDGVAVFLEKYIL